MKRSFKNPEFESEPLFLGLNNKHFHPFNTDRKMREAYLAFQREVEEDLDYDLFDDGYYDI